MGCGCGKKKASSQPTVQSESVGSVEVKKTIRQSHLYDDNDPVYLERLSICDGCPLKDQTNGRCKACGCFLQAKAKLINSHCPLPEPKW